MKKILLLLLSIVLLASTTTCYADITETTFQELAQLNEESIVTAKNDIQTLKNNQSRVYSALHYFWLNSINVEGVIIDLTAANKIALKAVVLEAYNQLPAGAAKTKALEIYQNL